MNTVKLLNDLSLLLLPKKRFQYWIKTYIPVLLLSSLLGTYLDLFMVGLKLYSFPIRPFPVILQINLLFSLVGLPISIFFFLILVGKRRKVVRAGIIVFFSLGMTVLEKKAEEFGIFAHSHSWSHLYTFVGYCLYLIVVHWFHNWLTPPIES